MCFLCSWNNPLFQNLPIESGGKNALDGQNTRDTDEVNPGKSLGCLMISLIKALPIPKDALKKKGLWSFVWKGLQHDIFLIVCAFHVYFYLCFLFLTCRSKHLLRNKLPEMSFAEISAYDLFSKMKRQKIGNFVCLFHMGLCRAHIFTMNAVCWWCLRSSSKSNWHCWCKSLSSCRCENASKDYNSVAYQQQRATCYSKEGGFM